MLGESALVGMSGRALLGDIRSAQPRDQLLALGLGSTTMPCRLRLLLSILLLASLLLPEVCLGGEKVRILIAGNQVAIDLLRWFFDTETAVIYHAVPARDPGAIYGFSEADLVKMIRQYFPRTYESLRTFDVLILTSPEYYLFTRPA